MNITQNSETNPSRILIIIIIIIIIITIIIISYLGGGVSELHGKRKIQVEKA